MSEVRTNEHQLGQWLPKEEFDQLRLAFIKDNKKKFVDFFERNGEFNDLSSQEREAGAYLMVRFFFGVDAVCKRFGNQDSEYRLLYDAGKKDEDHPFAYDQQEDRFLLNVGFLKKAIKKQIKQDPFLFAAAGLGSGGLISAGDLFELIGVEEGAHYLFYQEKDRPGQGALADAPDIYRYKTSEVESRALKWKTAYAGRYFPDYYEDFRRTSRTVRKLRSDSMRKRLSR